jgi:hypothetical protein
VCHDHHLQQQQLEK